MNHADLSDRASRCRRSFERVLSARLSRRGVLSGTLGGAAAFFSTPGVAEGQAPLVGFTPLPASAARGVMPAIAPEYEYQVLIPWGEPLVPGGPAYKHPPSSREQVSQVGLGHDGMWFFPAAEGPGGRLSSSRGVLCINHELATNFHVLGKAQPESLDEVRRSQLAHGVSVLELVRVGGRWQTEKSDIARRIHVNSPVRFSGPAASHALLQTPTGGPPAGTVNNCSNGHTPWGTYLTCEENIHGYFGATRAWTPTPVQLRYGFSATGHGYGWERFDPRFDLSEPAHRGEENRFGWVVEIDPHDPLQLPVKRTALGRFRHEGATVVVGRGRRVVVYMGDDQRFDYIYKFVSDGDFEAMRRQGRSPLDEGKLYAARFDEDGTGEWLELSLDNPKLAGRFADQGELLVYTRLAADLAGATAMDRPEWTAVATNGDVYCTLTNNHERQTPSAANPLAPNPDGHIIRWRDDDDHVGTRFGWDIFLLAQATQGTEAALGSPDGLMTDPDGRLFILTDGDQPQGINNQLVVADTRTGTLRRLFSGVPGAELTGLTITPDRRTLFVNVQHAGNGDPALTNFPASFDGVTIPRDATVAISRRDGGIVGS